MRGPLGTLFEIESRVIQRHAFFFKRLPCFRYNNHSTIVPHKAARITILQPSVTVHCHILHFCTNQRVRNLNQNSDPYARHEGKQASVTSLHSVGAGEWSALCLRRHIPR